MNGKHNLAEMVGKMSQRGLQTIQACLSQFNGNRMNVNEVPRERTTFLRSKKILNLCYRLVVPVSCNSVGLRH